MGWIMMIDCVVCSSLTHRGRVAETATLGVIILRSPLSSRPPQKPTADKAKIDEQAHESGLLAEKRRTAQHEG